MTVKEEMIKALENMIEIIKKEVPDDCELIVLRPFANEDVVGFFDKDFIETHKNKNNKLSVEVINDVINSIEDYYTYADEDCCDLINDNKKTKMSVIDFL